MRELPLGTNKPPLRVIREWYWGDVRRKAFARIRSLSPRDWEDYAPLVNILVRRCRECDDAEIAGEKGPGRMADLPPRKYRQLPSAVRLWNALRNVHRDFFPALYA
jgi:hypothetical protein